MKTPVTRDAGPRVPDRGCQSHSAPLRGLRGNLTTNGSANYLYDRANRMISTTLGGVTTQFSYNGDGARLRQVVSGVPTTYTQDLAAPLPVVLQAKTGSNATQYLYSIGTRPIGQYTSAWEYLLPDALGSVRQIADANGNITLAKSYEPYGSVLTSTGSASSIFAYAGEQIDSYIKLLFLRARYLQPTLGIFLARDPWSGEAMRPGSMSGWNYVVGNPVNGTDPTGKCEQNGDEECWGVYEQIITRCPECANLRSPNTSGEQPLYTARISYLRIILAHVLADWRPIFASSIEEALQQESSRFGLPWQIVAGVLETEKQIDTDPFWDPLQNTAYQLIPGLANSESNPGPGIGNIHVMTAKSTAEYFRDFYPTCWRMRLEIQPGDTNADVAWYLVNDFNTIRVLAAHVRQLADYRFGSNGRPTTTSHSNLTEWTITDAVMIWHGYRYGVPEVSPPGQRKGFKDLGAFQDRAKSLDQLIAEGLLIGDDAYRSTHESIPIFEKYFGISGK